MKQVDIFGNEAEIKEDGIMPGRNKSGGYIENPMHKAHGILETERCKDCQHIVRKSYSKVYYKCALRNNVDKQSVFSDHKVNWKACGKFLRE